MQCLFLRFAWRLKRKLEDFTSLQLSNIVLKGQRLGLNKMGDNDHGRSVRRLKRKPDDFTCLELSNMVMEGRQLGVRKIEDNDYERFARQLKRKPDKFTGRELSNIVMEGQQLGFQKIERNDHDDDDEDDMDPQYNMFLKKLMVDGESYALEVAQSNGVPVYLKYHVEGKSDDEDCGPPTRRKMSNGKKGEKIQARKENKYKEGSPKNSSAQGRERRDLMEHDADDLRIDECYRSFLNGIIKEDKYWVFVCTSGRRVVYEDDEDGGLSVSEIEVWDDAPHGSEGNPTPFVSGRREKIQKGEKIQARKENKHNKGSPKYLRSVQGRERRDLVEHDADDLRMDEGYQLFLNGIIKEDKYWVFVCTSGRRVVYEDDEDGGSSDSEIEVWDDAPHCSEGNPAPFVSGRGYRASEISQFRKKVMGILRRPYNQEEYEKLLRDIKEQKTVGRIKDLRSRPISFSVAGSTKSYLDHHLDVEREIYAVRHDQPKVLNILRGFFYWLEHIANEGEGVFKPWLDASCRAVVPARRR